MSVLFKLDKQDNTPPKLCFGSMCKNEEHVIIETLNSVYKHIDYWVICDTGSTDNTCKLIIDFFTEKNIPGELWLDEWCGFEVNKSLLFERCYNKSDFLLHLDADDWLMGDFNTDELYNTNADAYLFRLKRGSSLFKATILYNNRI
jgi:glycosyltransferase involved in cell wall biosynthesis